MDCVVQPAGQASKENEAELLLKALKALKRFVKENRYLSGCLFDPLQRLETFHHIGRVWIFVFNDRYALWTNKAFNSVSSSIYG